MKFFSNNAFCAFLHICMETIKKALWACHARLFVSPINGPIWTKFRRERNPFGSQKKSRSSYLIPKYPSLPGYQYYWFHCSCSRVRFTAFFLSFFCLPSAFCRLDSKNVRCTSAPSACRHLLLGFNQNFLIEIQPWAHSIFLFAHPKSSAPHTQLVNFSRCLIILFSLQLPIHEAQKQTLILSS